MIGFDLLTPWIGFGVTLALLLWMQRWIQRHLFGMGWIVAQEKHAASVIYTIVLLPGIFVHEFVEWILGGVLNLKTTVSLIWPEADEHGTIDPKFVQVSGTKNPVFLSIIGLAPFLIGLALTLWISNSLLNFPLLISALGTADLTLISPAFQLIFSKPDVILWLYLLFAISNTMMPTRVYIRSWLVFGALAAGFLIFLVVAGFQTVVLKWLSGPITDALNLLSTVFLTVLILDGFVALGLRGLEAAMERVMRRQAPYRAVTNAVARPVKAAVPRLTSIYQYRLPIPPVSRKEIRPAVAASASSSAALPKSPQPSLTSPAPKPAVAAPTSNPALPKPISRPTEQPASPVPKPAPNEPASTPKPAFAGSRPAASSPFAAKPAEPARQGQSSQPSRPANPTQGQPVRPAGAPPVMPRPALPASTSTPRPSTNLPVPAAKPGPPAPRSPFGAPPAASPRPKTDEPDYIDADVIEDDEPGFTKKLDDHKPFGSQPRPSSLFSKDQSNDEDDHDEDDEPKYVDLDDSP